MIISKTLIWAMPFIMISAFGCAQVKDTVKSVLGVSTRELENDRNAAIKKVLDFDYPTSFQKVKDTLKKKGSYIYEENIKQHFIALYISEADTTPVGVFFKEIDTTHTQIEIASPSKAAKEFIAMRLTKGASPNEKEADVE